MAWKYGQMDIQWTNRHTDIHFENKIPQFFCKMGKKNELNECQCELNVCQCELNEWQCELNEWQCEINVPLDMYIQQRLRLGCTSSDWSKSSLLGSNVWQSINSQCCSNICIVKLQLLEHHWLIYRGWFKLVFESLGNSSNSSRKQIFMDILGKFSDLIIKMYAACTHQNCLIEAILMSTFNIPLFYGRSETFP